MDTKKMKGRASFTQAEAVEICKYLDTDRFKRGPEVNKKASAISSFLRKRFRFYITDFTKAKGFGKQIFAN